MKVRFDGGVTATNPNLVGGVRFEGGITPLSNYQGVWFEGGLPPPQTGYWFDGGVTPPPNFRAGLVMLVVTLWPVTGLWGG